MADRRGMPLISDGMAITCQLAYFFHFEASADIIVAKFREYMVILLAECQLQLFAHFSALFPKRARPQWALALL